MAHSTQVTVAIASTVLNVLRLIEPLRAAICELNAQTNAVATPHYNTYNETAQRLMQTLQMLCEKVCTYSSYSTARAYIQTLLKRSDRRLFSIRVPSVVP